MGTVSKWAPGTSCTLRFVNNSSSLAYNAKPKDGPILSQTDLYLLNPEVELNPILEGKSDNQLQFHLVTGKQRPIYHNAKPPRRVVIGFTTSARAPNTDSPFVGKDEPATLPRVSQLIVISRLSPWCTIIRKDTGITIGDLCSAIYKEYDMSFYALTLRF